MQEYLDGVQITNFPNKALRFAVLNTSLLVLGLKLNTAALEEEDTELVQLVTAAMQTNKGLLDKIENNQESLLKLLNRIQRIEEIQTSMTEIYFK